MIITESILHEIAPTAPAHAAVFVPHLNKACKRYEINMRRRIAMFLAQVAHESGGFHYVEEIASGKAYEGRKDLGNTHPGDGPKYKGRGLIQITGRVNYLALSEAFGVDFVNVPRLLQQDEYACLSAGWKWQQIKGNGLADLPDTWRSLTKHYSPFMYITWRINGGLTGYVDRLRYCERAFAALKETA